MGMKNEVGKTCHIHPVVVRTKCNSLLFRKTHFVQGAVSSWKKFMV